MPSAIGEFSWSVESLLNRVISQTLLRSPDILFVVRDAVAAMPQLVDEIDGGTRHQRGYRGDHGARGRAVRP